MKRCTKTHDATEGDEHLHFETWEEVHRYIDDLGYGHIRDTDGDVITEMYLTEDDTVRVTYIPKMDWADGVTEEDHPRTYVVAEPIQLHTFTQPTLPQTVVDEAIASILSTYEGE